MLSETFLFDIVRKNKDGARDFLVEMCGQPQLSTAAKQAMFDDLASQFNSLDHSTILACLEKNLYDFSIAASELIELNRLKQIEKRKENEERIRKESVKQIHELFEDVPLKEIQDLLDQNFGNVNRTTEVLMQKIKEKEEKRHQQKLTDDLSKRLQIEKKCGSTIPK